MSIPLPNKPKYIKKEGDLFLFEIEPCYPGYGHTLGNALRRVLLSSLEGAAATTVKISGVKHEFSTIPYIQEDVIEIILNLKQLRFKMHSTEPVRLTLKAKGEGTVKAKNFKCPTQVEIVNKEHHIATLTDKKASLDLEIQVERGLGYVPREERGREKLEVGAIALDAIFSPIEQVFYNVENMRVGERTDYNKLIIGVKTDKSIDAKDALKKAAGILADHFSRISEKPEKKERLRLEKKEAEVKIKEKEKAKAKPKPKVDPKKLKVEELDISSKVKKILKANKIKTVAGILQKKEISLEVLKGLGPQGIKEIKRAIGRLGLILKQ